MSFVDFKGPVFIFVLSAFFLLLSFGCSERDESANTVSKDEGEKLPVVAKVGDNSITVWDLKSYLSDRSMSLRHRNSREDLTKRLDEMVIEEVLYQEALRLNLDKDPKVQRSIRQMLTQKLIEEQVNKEAWSRKIEEKEVQEYYDSHKDEFLRPEQIRLADIYVAVPPDASDEQRAELRKKAEKILAEALNTRKQRAGFGKLIREYSDTPEKYRKGDTGYFDKEGKPVDLSAQMVEAAFKLEKSGSIAEHVIEAPDGYHVIMRTANRSAIERPLDSVRNQLEQRIRREDLKKEREAYIEGLKKKGKIRIDTQVMAGILEELNRTARTGQPLSTNISPLPMPGGASKPPSLPMQGN